MNILFVCTGNTCRSPMAEAILKAKQPGWKVKSAGLFANAGAGASEGAAAILTEKGLAGQHTSVQLTEQLIEWADVVLTMTASHKQTIDIHFPQYRDKVKTLKGTRGDVADPFGGPVSLYRETFSEIEEAVDQWLEKTKAARK